MNDGIWTNGIENIDILRFLHSRTIGTSLHQIVDAILNNWQVRASLQGTENMADEAMCEEQKANSCQLIEMFVAVLLARTFQLFSITSTTPSFIIDFSDSSEQRQKVRYNYVISRLVRATVDALRLGV
ncbi:hypothetical protein DPMN_117564 [Dreissena polymorpha]|uniref:Uncharacterized protein n=1 Tax=Dreissena polymorpha TaxID=45954 RepID=A0A9D4GFR3_DREPO|nr:hypothetical protein DPMN_117564 [Dreissena polymorpha]